MQSESSSSVGLTHKCVSLPQAETRAEFAERSVAKLEKTIDDLEGTIVLHCTSEFHSGYHEIFIMSVMVFG